MSSYDARSPRIACGGDLAARDRVRPVLAAQVPPDRGEERVRHVPDRVDVLDAGPHPLVGEHAVVERAAATARRPACSGAAPTPTTTTSAGMRSPDASTTACSVVRRPRRRRLRRCGSPRRCRGAAARRPPPSSGPIAALSGTAAVPTHGHVVAVAAGRRGDLQADPAGADDDDAPSADLERRAQPRAVLDACAA